MEPTEALATLDQLPVGSRILVRSKKNWRVASVAAVRDELIVLTVCSSSGRTYRLRRQTDAAIIFEGVIPILQTDTAENWRDNFSVYDLRW